LENVVCITGFLSRDLLYVFGSKFRNIQRHVSYLQQITKKIRNLPYLIGIAGNDSEFYKYLPLSSISCSREITS
jgi:hypothetical protein